MYKYLLCFRYLRTRVIALASIISVMLGVATMIVVNAVMSGFTHEMENRIHGVLSDIVVARHGFDAMSDPQGHMAKIRSVAGDDIEAMTPAVVTLGMLTYRRNGQYMTPRPIQLVGIDTRTQGAVNRFSEYLQHSENRKPGAPVFELRGGGYDTQDHQAMTSGREPNQRPQMKDAGWRYRQHWAKVESVRQQLNSNEPPVSSREPRVSSHSFSDSILQTSVEMPVEGAEAPAMRAVPLGVSPIREFAFRRTSTESTLGESAEQPFAYQGDLPAGVVHEETVSTGVGEQGFDDGSPAPPMVNPFAARQDALQAELFDPGKEQHTGTVLGIALSIFPGGKGIDHFGILPGDDVQITLGTAGTPPKGVSDTFTVTDFYESKMSEFDSKLVFVPIRRLQELQGLIDPITQQGKVSTIQIKLKEGVDPVVVRDKLRAAFPTDTYLVNTWRDEKGGLLEAVRVEKAILNVLLFMIILVAGFGILAIFLTIVMDKTRDIGILKSLGASSSGVAGIFVSYGLVLGVIGSIAGLVLGLIFVANINEIADWIGRLTDRQIFDPNIYYFYEIPALVQPWTVFWIVSGAIFIAVFASVVPALRAATLHPVEALRYE